jgi:2,3-bisphosphoglycerate-independent phosphoglycerate mutase
MGILSAAGVHGHIEHLFQLMLVCRERGVNPFIHVILDGRDSGLRDGYVFLNMLNGQMQALKLGRIASICGRQYSMDRDHRWERVEVAYNAMVGLGQRTATDPMDALQNAYSEEENDQTFLPTTIVDNAGVPVGSVKDNDVMIFYNYREDRAREITKAFVMPDFDGFRRDPFPKNLYFVTMMGYEEGLPVHVLFEPHVIKSTIASIISDAGYKQIHIAETEKYAHISYFFNGGIEAHHEGEMFYNIPSPKVFNYAQTPEMSALVIRDEVLNIIKREEYNFILINFANPDMLGHTGDFQATVKSIEVMDLCLKDIIAAAREKGADLVVTSDHGNCEQKIDLSTGEALTAHTSNPVPVVICRNCIDLKWDGTFEKIGTGVGAVSRGILADIAPTVLRLMNLQSGGDMTGVDLLSAIPEDKSLQLKDNCK